MILARARVRDVKATSAYSFEKSFLWDGEKKPELISHHLVFSIRTLGYFGVHNSIYRTS